MEGKQGNGKGKVKKSKRKSYEESTSNVGSVASLKTFPANDNTVKSHGNKRFKIFGALKKNDSPSINAERNIEYEKGNDTAQPLLANNSNYGINRGSIATNATNATGTTNKTVGISENVDFGREYDADALLENDDVSSDENDDNRSISSMDDKNVNDNIDDNKNNNNKNNKNKKNNDNNNNNNDNNNISNSDMKPKQSRSQSYKNSISLHDALTREQKHSRDDMDDMNDMNDMNDVDDTNDIIDVNNINDENNINDNAGKNENIKDNEIGNGSNSNITNVSASNITPNDSAIAANETNVTTIDLKDFRSEPWTKQKEFLFETTHRRYSGEHTISDIGHSGAIFNQSKKLSDDINIGFTKHRRHTDQLLNNTMSRKTAKSLFLKANVPADDYQFFDKPKAKRRVERLNFDILENEIMHLNWVFNSERGWYKWIICLTIGILTGITMYTVTIVITATLLELLGLVRYTLLHDGFIQAFSIYLGFNLFFASLAGASVVWISTVAGGSGIPEVKAYLNGSWIPHLFNVRTFVVKMFGIACAVSGSFIVGKEGPMVHAGSIIANGVSRGRSRTFGCDSGMLHSFRNDRDARDFVCVGAAAGVSAAFSAPIGGMLFALEEVSSFWNTSLTWRAFFAAAISTFIVVLGLSCWDGSGGNLSCGTFTRSGLITFSSQDVTENQYNLLQFIAFLVIGALGGFLGAWFNYINVKLCAWRMDHIHKKRIYRFIEVLFGAILTTSVVMFIPYFFGHCKSVPTCSQSDDDTCDNLGKYSRWTCDENEYNPLAALLVGRREDIIKNVFHYDTQQFFEVYDVVIAMVLYFLLSAFTYGLSIPSGLFIPMILVGCNLGWLCGFGFDHLFGQTFSRNTYALMGASAMLGGATRMTVSLTAIVLEITNDINYLLPIMLTVMVSKWVGDRFNAAIYESHVALKGVLYLEEHLPKFIPPYCCATDVMTKNVCVLPVIAPLRVVARYLRSEKKLHNAFPIIDAQPYSRHYKQNDGRFLGIMLRWHIIIIILKRHFATLQDLPKLTLLDEKEFTNSDHKNRHNISCKMLHLSWHDLNTYYIDFSPYMHLSPFVVQKYTPILRVYQLFRGLGLRHLIVLDINDYIAGIITADNLSEKNLEHSVLKMWTKLQTSDKFRQRFIAMKTRQGRFERIKINGVTNRSNDTQMTFISPTNIAAQRMDMFSPHSVESQGMVNSIESNYIAIADNTMSSNNNNGNGSGNDNSSLLENTLPKSGFQMASDVMSLSEARIEAIGKQAKHFQESMLRVQKMESQSQRNLKIVNQGNKTPKGSKTPIVKTKRDRRNGKNDKIDDNASEHSEAVQSIATFTTNDTALHYHKPKIGPIDANKNVNVNHEYVATPKSKTKRVESNNKNGLSLQNEPNESGSSSEHTNLGRSDDNDIRMRRSTATPKPNSK